MTNVHTIDPLPAVASETEVAPLVSVIMPVRNGERFIEEAISSILGQTLRGLELIVVVNGSTDASLSIASQFARTDARVRVIERDEKNIALALNTGIVNARAAWIARMDADDVALPDRLERQLNFLSRNADVAALGTWGWRIGANGKPVSILQAGPSSREEFARTRDAGPIYLLSSSVIFSRQVSIDLAGFREDYPPAEDVEFWTRIADTHLVLALPERLVKYRIHQDSQSTRHMLQQIRNTRRVEVNMHRRRNGLEELTDDQFSRLERLQPLTRRTGTRLRVESQRCYRRAGSLLANGNPMGLVWLVASCLLSPTLPIRRLREQAVLPTLLPQRHRSSATGSSPPILRRPTAPHLTRGGRP